METSNRTNTRSYYYNNSHTSQETSCLMTKGIDIWYYSL